MVQRSHLLYAIVRSLLTRARPADSVARVGARARAGPLHQPLFRQAGRCGSDRTWAVAVAAAGRIFTVINM